MKSIFTKILLVTLILSTTTTYPANDCLSINRKDAIKIVAVTLAVCAVGYIAYKWWSFSAETDRLLHMMGATEVEYDPVKM